MTYILKVSIDEAFLYNNTDSTIVAQFACDVTESYPDYLPKFPDVEKLCEAI